VTTFLLPHDPENEKPSRFLKIAAFGGNAQAPVAPLDLLKISSISPIK